MRPMGLLSFWVGVALAISVSGGEYADRFVWIFGWNLSRDSDAVEITRLLDTASEHGINGAVVSFGLDTLCQKSPEFFRRLDQVKQSCEKRRIELIPAIFSVGYGGSVLAHNRNLAEGLPVIDAPFVAEGPEARFAPDSSAGMANGGFEESSENRLAGFRLQDRPGAVSFVDRQVKHGGNSSLRMERFDPQPPGHGRIMQELKLHPHRAYRMSLWVRTDGLEPASGFRMQVLAGRRNLSSQKLSVASTSDWRKVTMVFNSHGFETVRAYAGVWEGRRGRVWLDDWTLEEIGPFNALHRPGTPVTVRSDDGSRTYTEGKDYARLEDPRYSLRSLDRPWPGLRLLPGGTIRDGERLRVSWYHSMSINDSQVTVCMGEPELYEIFEHESRLLAQHLRPRRIFLNMDEVRMGGTCEACRGQNMGALLGECITKQTRILQRHNPNARIYVWSDMLDPNHNAHGDYYLVEGDFTGSWTHVPRDLVIAVWGGAPREKSLQFFDDLGFETLVACYYDGDDLEDAKGWIRIAGARQRVRGFMYTPWQKKYELLPAFGDLLQGR